MAPTSTWRSTRWRWRSHRDHINAFVIVGGDSDFITLVEKLKQYDKKVFIVGGRAFTSTILQKNCHEFIAYENLIRSQSSGRRQSRSRSASEVPVEKAVPLILRALKILTDREVSPQLGLLKSTLLQLDSTFSERDYGATTFRDFMEKLARTGVINLKQVDRSWLVELREERSDNGARERTTRSRKAKTSSRRTEGIPQDGSKESPGPENGEEPTGADNGSGPSGRGAPGDPIGFRDDRYDPEMANVPAERQTVPQVRPTRLQREGIWVLEPARRGTPEPEARCLPPRAEPAGCPPDISGRRDAEGFGDGGGVRNGGHGAKQKSM